MNSYVFLISLYLANIFNFLMFAASVFYCYRPINPSYLRTFPIYCLANILTETIVMLQDKGYFTTGVNNYFFYNIFTLFELVYLSWFFTRLIRSGIAKKIVWSLNGVFFIHFFYFIASGRIQVRDASGYLIDSIILILPCLVYFRELFTHPQSGNITREPSFWIITAFLFYFSLGVPTILLNTYFKSHRMYWLSNSIYSINNYAQILSNILIIKGFRCRIKQPY